MSNINLDKMLSDKFYYKYGMYLAKLSGLIMGRIQQLLLSDNTSNLEELKHLYKMSTCIDHKKYLDFVRLEVEEKHLQTTELEEKIKTIEAQLSKEQE